MIYPAMLNHRCLKIVRIWPWNLKRNIFSFISCLKIWEWEKYYRMALGCKKIHKPGTKFSSQSPTLNPADKFHPLLANPEIVYLQFILPILPSILLIQLCVYVCVCMCVCVCVCLCVRVYVYSPWRLHLSKISWNTRKQINNVVLKTFIFHADSLHL